MKCDFCNNEAVRTLQSGVSFCEDCLLNYLDDMECCEDDLSDEDCYDLYDFD